LADAAFISESPLFSRTASEWLARRDPAGARRLVIQFKSFADHFGYSDVIMTDARGKEVLATRRGGLLADSARDEATAISRPRPLLTDPYPGPGGGRPRLAIIAPLSAENGGPPFGAVVLECEADRTLYPFLKTWPVPSATAETFLVRKIDGDVLFLSDLRGRKDAPLKFRIPMTQRSAPAILAASGVEGIARGTDYRGVKVLSALRPIPGSDWFIIGKVDMDEAFAESRRESARLILLMLALAGAALTLVEHLRRQGEKARDRKMFETERALGDSRSDMAALLNATDESAFLMDPEGVVLAANEILARRLEQPSPASIIGKNIYDYLPPEVSRLRKTYKDECLRSGKPVRYEDEREGRKFETNVFPVFNEDGLTTRLAILVRDITAQKQMEEALRKSETRFRTLFESSSEAVMLLDDKGFFDCNAATLRIFGCPSKEAFCAKHPADVSPPFQTDGTDSSTASRGRMAEAMEKGSHRFEWTHKRLDDGLSFPAEVLLTRMVLEGRPVLQAVVRDITGSKLAEMEKEKLQADLTQAQKMETVGRLAGGVAHDFNNMLWIIFGFAELALKHVAESDPIRSFLEEVRKAARRCAELTNQLLTFSRRQPISPKVVDLSRSVENLRAVLRQLLGEDITHEWKLAEGLWPILADPIQIDQVLTNLAANARDAMKGTGRFAIETSNAILDEASCAGRRGFIPGDYVRLSVSDTGHGMDKTTMEHAFEPFFTTKPVGRGTGLGLAMVYGIVQQNHGFVGVESDLDRGTTFSIYLPRHIGPPSSAPAVDGGEPAGGIGEVVLLVEDEPAALRMASRMLEGLGYAVLPARTPAEALKRAESREQGIDLILTDVIMPEMNGRDLAEKVRALRPGIKVLYMSGYSGEIIARQGALEEGVRLLQKPFSEKALARAIREALAE